MAEEQLKQQKSLTEVQRRSAIKAQREAEAARVQVVGLNQAVMELRAAEVEQSAALAMADQTESELREALQKAEARGMGLERQLTHVSPVCA